MVTRLEGRKIAIFDTEIKNVIDNVNVTWKTHDKMGVSVLVIFDYETMRYRVFEDRNIHEGLDILTTHDLVSGFNTVKFDWELLKASYPDYFANHGAKLSKDYDVLREIWISKGLDPDTFVPYTHGGYKLDDVAFETLGLRKTGDGAQAPHLYQQARIAELHDYCIQDVRVEKELFEFAVKYGYVVRKGQVIPLRPLILND